MSKTTYQVTGHIIADNVSGVNNDHSLTIELPDMLQPKERNAQGNKKKWRDSPSIISVCAIILSVIAILCVIFGTTVACASILVSALGVLVALLVGWQIFNLIKIDRLKGNLESIQDEVEMARSQSMEDITELGNLLRSEINLVRSQSWSMRGQYTTALNYAIIGLEYQNKCKEQSSELIDFIDAIFTHQDYTWLTKEQQDRIMGLLQNSKSDESLKLLIKIAKIQPPTK